MLRYLTGRMWSAGRTLPRPALRDARQCHQKSYWGGKGLACCVTHFFNCFQKYLAFFLKIKAYMKKKFLGFRCLKLCCKDRFTVATQLKKQSYIMFTNFLFQFPPIWLIFGKLYMSSGVEEQCHQISHADWKGPKLAKKWHIFFKWPAPNNCDFTFQ